MGNMITKDVNFDLFEIPSDVLENVVKDAADISKEMDRVITMTPKDGYQKKIDLIVHAEDLSTKEKIEAIDAAENKYVQDLSESAELCKDMMWTKVALVLACSAGIVLMASTPGGRKFAKSILKAVA